MPSRRRRRQVPQDVRPEVETTPLHNLVIPGIANEANQERPASAPEDQQDQTMAQGDRNRRGQDELDPQMCQIDQRPSTKFSDIVGCQTAKEQLRDICHAVNHPEQRGHFGEQIASGILLVGPPGCGKTMMAKATAHNIGCCFLRVRVAHVVSCWFGQSERNLQAVFDYAKTQEKALIFFDEIDALGANRDATPFAGGVTQRIVATLLENLDGLESSDDASQVIVLAASNRPRAIDPALTREGRFDVEIKVLPPGFIGRRQMFRAVIGEHQERANRQFTEGVDVDALCRLPVMVGKTPAQMRELIRRVIAKRARRWRRNAEQFSDQLTTEDFRTEINSMFVTQPRLRPQLTGEYRHR